MYEFIRGSLFSSSNNQAVLDVNGVGYLIGISLNTFAALPALGDEVILYTHFHVTENSHTLYGFLTEDERSVFESLIAINKVGPKVAINILSGMSVERLVYAVENQDVTGFKGVSGVGPKTAQRLVLELKGKLNVSVDLSDMPSSPTQKSKPLSHAIEDEAYTALIALGYNDTQVRTALARVGEVATADIPVHEWITMALKVI